MSVEIIHCYYDAFNKRDYSAMLNLLSEEICHDVNQGERRVGKQKFKAFMAEMDEHYAEQVKQLVVFTSSTQGRFAAEFTIEGIYKRSQAGLPAAHNQIYSLAVGAFFEIKHGEIVRITNYYNLQNWLNLVST